MKLIRIVVLVSIFIFQGFGADEKININFKDLKIIRLLQKSLIKIF